METTSLGRFYWLTLKGVATVIKGAIEIVLGLVALVASVAIWFSEDIAKKISDFPTVNKWWCLGAVGLYFFHLWMKSMHAQFVDIEKKYFEMHKPTSLAGLCDRLENLGQIAIDTTWEELLQHAGDIVLQCHTAGGFRLDATAHDDIARAKEGRLFVQVYDRNPIDPSYFGTRPTREWYTFYVAAAAALRQIKDAPRGPDKALATLPAGIDGIVYAAKVIAEYVRVLRGEAAITIREHDEAIASASAPSSTPALRRPVSPFEISWEHGYPHQIPTVPGTTTAQLRIHNKSTMALVNCSIRMTKLSPILPHGAMLSPSDDGSGYNRRANPQFLFWDDASGYGTTTRVNIPPKGDRTVVLVGYRRAGIANNPREDPWVLVLFGSADKDGRSIGEGWFKIDVKVESETDGVAPLEHSFLVGFHPRADPGSMMEPVIGMNNWDPDGPRLLEAIRAERSKPAASSSPEASPPSSPA